MFVDVGAKFPPFSWIWFRRLGEWQLARTEVRHAAREIHFRRTIRQFPPHLHNSISRGLTTSASGTARSPPRTRPAPSTSTSATSPETSSSRPGGGDRSVDAKIFFVEYQIFFLQWRRCHVLLLGLCAASALLSAVCVVAFILVLYWCLDTRNISSKLAGSLANYLSRASVNHLYVVSPGSVSHRFVSLVPSKKKTSNESRHLHSNSWLGILIVG